MTARTFAPSPLLPPAVVPISPRTPPNLPFACALLTRAHVRARPRLPLTPQVRKGTKAVAVWVDGHGYACEVLGSAGRRQLAVQFEDGLQYDCAAADLRILLDEPLCAASLHALRALHAHACVR